MSNVRLFLSSIQKVDEKYESMFVLFRILEQLQTTLHVRLPKLYKGLKILCWSDC